MAVSFDLFGTLVAVEPQDDAAAAIATELARRDTAVPDDWGDAYGEAHADVPPERERSLVAHVRDALDACGVSDALEGRGASDDALEARDVSENALDVPGANGDGITRDGDAGADPDPVADAVRAALFPDPSGVATRDGAERAVAAATAHGPAGVLSNCSVPGLAGHCLDASGLDPAAFDAVTTSVACGWRKPSPRAFRAVADALGVEPGDLVHVGDDPRTDDGVTDVGGEFVPIEEIPLAAFPAWLDGEKEGKGGQC